MTTTPILPELFLLYVCLCVLGGIGALAVLAWVVRSGAMDCAADQEGRA